MYFVLTREEDDYKNLFGGAWGYYWDLESAIDAVHRNVTDMHETISSCLTPMEWKESEQLTEFLKRSQNVTFLPK